MDRAEAKDYRDISAMLSAGVSLETALGGFAKMYGKDPGLPLRAMGFFKDGDLPSLPKSDQDFLRSARDRVSEIPEVAITHGSLAGTARQQRPCILPLITVWLQVRAPAGPTTHSRNFAFSETSREKAAFAASCDV